MHRCQSAMSALHRCARHDERALLGDALFRVGATAAATDLLEHWARLLPDDPVPRHRPPPCAEKRCQRGPPDGYVTYPLRPLRRYVRRIAQVALAITGQHWPRSCCKAAEFTPDRQLNVLDAGCGTGLCASVLRLCSALDRCRSVASDGRRHASAAVMTRWWSPS